MKTPLTPRSAVWLFTLVGSLFHSLPPSIVAATPAAATNAPSTAITAGKPLVTAAGSVPRPTPVRFRPLTTNAPVVRVTGGTRGTGDQAVQLDVLAPDDIGLTTSEQPDLFWFQSHPSQAKFELTLLRPKQSKPLLRIQRHHATTAGIQRVSLVENSVKLEKNVEYQWVVALITDPANRSTDLVASGMIKLVDPPSSLRDTLKKSNGMDAASALANAGIWYDALSTLSQMMERNPNDASLKQARADLLAQVGLKAAAAHDAP